MSSSGIEAATFRFVAQRLNHCAAAVTNLLGLGSKLYLCFCNDVPPSVHPIKIMKHIIIFIEADDQRVRPEPEETIFHSADYKIRPLEE